MYVRLTRASFDPERYEEVARLFEEAMAAFREQPGFQHYYAAADRDAGTMIAVSMWYREEHSRLDRALLGDVIPHLRAAGVRLEDPEIYEVVARV